MNKKSGLTLLELLLVMFLIGILAAGMLTGFRTITIKGNDKSAQMTLRMILSAADAYRERYSTYPDSATGLNPGTATSLVGRGYMNDPNPPTGSVRTDWIYAITASSATAINITATGRAGTGANGRSFSINKSIAGGVITITSGGAPDNTDWYARFR